MKTTLSCGFLILTLIFSAAAADLTGKWSGAFASETGDTGSAYIVVQQSGSRITGTGGPDANTQWPGLTGSITGNKVSFQVTSADDGTVYKCSLVLDGDHLKGEVLFTPPQGQEMKATLDLTRVTQ
jgi:hypothetical protein